MRIDFVADEEKGGGVAPEVGQRLVLQYARRPKGKEGINSEKRKYDLRNYRKIKEEKYNLSPVTFSLVLLFFF